jgi:hypothetical protein
MITITENYFMNYTTTQRIFVFVFLLCAALTTHAIVRCEDAFSDADDFELSFDDMTDYIKDNPEASTLRAAASANVVGGVLSKISRPLWNTTHAPVGRDTLYLLPHKITAVEYGGLAVTMFFNMTDRMHLTTSDIFSIPDDKNFYDTIENLIPIAGKKDVAALIPLLQKITLQERKSGILFQPGFNHGPFTVQINTSLQFGARNFWLSRRDQKIIRELVKSQYGGGEVNESEFYILSAGLGDTRIKVGLNTINTTSFQSDLGFEVIMPTSQLFSKPPINIGLSGAAFDADQDAANGIKNLKAIRDYILTPRFGNNGHLGLGCYVESKIGIFHDLVQLSVRASYDHIFPSDEERIFMFAQTITAAEIANLPSATAGSPQDFENRDKVNRFIRENIFPSSFKSASYPGGITNFVFTARFNMTKRWAGAFGYDFYAQKEEKIKSIYNTTISINELKVLNAEAHYAQQHKIFTEVFYHNKKKHSDVGVAVGGDVTFAKRNIGEDWTLYFKVSTSF